MNPAFEKLEKEIAELEGQSEHFKFCESSGDESWRLTMKVCRKKADERLAEKRALKACVEALEEIEIKAEAHKEWVTGPNSHWECLYCHQVNGKHSAACIYTVAKAATSIVNRAMGVSHE